MQQHGCEETPVLPGDDHRIDLAAEDENRGPHRSSIDFRTWKIYARIVIARIT